MALEPVRSPRSPCAAIISRGHRSKGIVLHYYQFNIGDYASHTIGLTLLEDLAYRRLIDFYYLSEHPLNGCSSDVARMIGMRENTQEVEYVLQCYFTKNGNEWVHDRIDSDIADYHQKQEKRSIAGKKSGEKRQKQTLVDHVLNTCSTSVELTNNHKPITNNQEDQNTHVADESPTCPHQEIIDLYHKHCPTLPKVKVWTNARQSLLKSRWRESPKHQSLEFWEKYLKHVSNSPFLIGSDGAWQADLEWLVRPSNFVKVIEGKYHRQSS